MEKAALLASTNPSRAKRFGTPATVRIRNSLVRMQSCSRVGAGEVSFQCGAYVITGFLKSLTAHWDGKPIAVIDSGYDGDGAAALCGIKNVGGITIAQKARHRLH